MHLRHFSTTCWKPYPIQIEARSRRLRRSKGQTHFPSYPLKLVKNTHDGTTYILAATLLDCSRYGIQTLSDAYHSRWGIEELYKNSKQMMMIEQLHAQSERGVKQELYAHFVLLLIVSLFGNILEDELNAGALNNNRSSRRISKMCWLPWPEISKL